MHVADRAQGLGHIYTSLYYCCKSFPVLLHDVMVGGWIASYVFIFIFWSRCRCCCCVLLLLPTKSVLKGREVPPTVSSFSVSATTINTFLCVYSIAVAAAEKGYAFFFFGRGAAVYNISTESERGTGYCFFLLRFCPLHCDASDVYCCCCFWLILFLSFGLRCFG